MLRSAGTFGASRRGAVVFLDSVPFPPFSARLMICNCRLYTIHFAVLYSSDFCFCFVISYGLFDRALFRALPSFSVFDSHHTPQFGGFCQSYSRQRLAGRMSFMDGVPVADCSTDKLNAWTPCAILRPLVRHVRDTMRHCVVLTFHLSQAHMFLLFNLISSFTPETSARRVGLSGFHGQTSWGWFSPVCHPSNR